jgi:Flp pilus assembly protein TadD
MQQRDKPRSPRFKPEQRNFCARALPHSSMATTGLLLRIFERALALQPKMAEARAGLGEALAATGQFDEAIEQDLQALALAPDKNAVRMNLATAYFKKGDLANARAQGEALHAAAPATWPPRFCLGSVYIKMGRDAEAVDLLAPLEQGHEADMDLEYVLGFSLIQTGRDKEGVPRMEKVAQARHSASAYVIAGASHLHNGEMIAARTDLDGAMSLDPTIPGLATMAGQARYAMMDMAAAAAAFQLALRTNPADPTANLDLGAIRLKEGISRARGRFWNSPCNCSPRCRWRAWKWRSWM